MLFRNHFKLLLKINIKEIKYIIKVSKNIKQFNLEQSHLKMEDYKEERDADGGIISAKIIRCEKFAVCYLYHISLFHLV